VWPGSVVFLGAEMECSAAVSLDLRVQLSSVLLEGASPMVEELRRGAVRAYSGPRFRRGTSLVTTAQLSMACFVLLSWVVGGGGVVCRVCLFLFGGLFVWWCSLRRVIYRPLLLLK
jgi:hypothetical protein